MLGEIIPSTIYRPAPLSGCAVNNYFKARQCSPYLGNIVLREGKEEGRASISAAGLPGLQTKKARLPLAPCPEYLLP